MLEILFLALHLIATFGAFYLMVAAYAVLWDHLTPMQGLLWLPYKPCEWLWSLVSKPKASAPSGGPAGPSEPTISFTAAEVAALKKLASDLGTDIGAILKGGLRPTAPKPTEAAPVVPDAAPPAGRIPA